jgi:tetratricopeptide (TPR) repeat protein
MRHIALILVLICFPSRTFAQTAEESYQQGQEAFDKNDYDGAVHEWNRSLEMAPDAVSLHFNIGQAHRLAGRCIDALREYRAFVKLDSSDHSVAEQFIEDLETKCDDTVPAKAPEVDAPLPPPKTRPKAQEVVVEEQPKAQGGTKKMIGLVLVGAGAATFLTGTYFGHRADTIADEVSSVCQTGCNWQTVEDRDSAGKSAETKQWVLYGVGTAAVAAGVVTYYLGWRDEHQPIVVGPVAGRGAMIAWRMSW